MMTMTRKNSRLPSLSAHPEYEKINSNPSTPANLHGARYPKIGSAESVHYFPPVDEEEENHPMPYYHGEDVSLPAIQNAPWLDEVRKKNKSMYTSFMQSKKLQNDVVEDLITEFVHEEVTNLASLTISQSKYQEETDQLAIEILEEEILTPGIHDEVYLVIWGLFFDMARDLSPEEYLELKEKEDQLVMDEKAKHALVIHVAEGEDWAKDLTEERMLSGINWEILLFHYYSNLHHCGLANNVAMHMLQEELAAQAAGEVFIRIGLLEVLEKEMIEFDNEEKTAQPPRWG